MNKHMLLIGGSTEIHPKAKKFGFRLTWLFDKTTLSKCKNTKIYDRIIGLPFTGENKEWRDIARLIHSIDRFDCIGGFSEATQELAALIAQDLGLSFHHPDVICFTRQKDKMRKLLREKEVDSTASCIVKNASDIAAFGKRYGYPLVLKPVDGRGSLSVSIIQSAQEIQGAMRWFEKWASDKSKLVEQYLQGEEYSVEAFSEEGQHRVVCITQKFKDSRTCVETGHCLPAPLPEFTRNIIEQFVIRVLTAIGIENGPSHTEVIVTADGPRIVETHTRLAGDNIVELIHLTSGVDLDEAWIRQSAGEKLLSTIPSHLSKYASISFVTPTANGTLERVDGINEALAQPGVTHVELLQPLGTRMEAAHDSNSRGAFAIAMGDNAAEATTRARNASFCLRFILSCKG